MMIRRHVSPMSLALGRAVCVLAFASPALALAQVTTPTSPPVQVPPSSTEQGHTELDESFGPLTHD